MQGKILVQKVTCQCCDKTINDGLILPCQHCCCKPCLRHYIHLDFKKEINFQTVNCPLKTMKNIACNIPMTFETLANFFGSEVFEQLISDAFTIEKQVDCLICQEKLNLSEVVELMCGHKGCVDCVKQMLKFKYDETKGNLMISEFKCMLGDQCKSKCVINEQMISKYLGLEQLIKISQHTAEKLFTNDKCPLCQNLFDNSENFHRQKVNCPYCHEKICLKCKSKDHSGDCVPPELNYLRDVRKGIGYQNLSFCPECKIQYTKDDGCNHVTCYKCKKDFCFQCCAPREPTLTHGNQYHRRECPMFEAWNDPKTKKEFLIDPELCNKCEQCQATKKVCPRPVEFQEFIESIKNQLNFSQDTMKKIIKRQNQQKN